MLLTLLHPHLPSTAVDLALPPSHIPINIEAMSALIPLNRHFYRVGDLAIKYASQINLRAADVLKVWKRIEAAELKPISFNVFHGYDLYVFNNIMVEVCPNRCTLKPENLADVDRIPHIYSARTPQGQEEEVYFSIRCVYSNRNGRG